MIFMIFMIFIRSFGHFLQLLCRGSLSLGVAWLRIVRPHPQTTPGRRLSSSLFCCTTPVIFGSGRLSETWLSPHSTIGAKAWKCIILILVLNGFHGVPQRVNDFHCFQVHVKDLYRSSNNLIDFHTIIFILPHRHQDHHYYLSDLESLPRNVSWRWA